MGLCGISDFSILTCDSTSHLKFDMFLQQQFLSHDRIKKRKQLMTSHVTTITKHGCLYSTTTIPRYRSESN